MAMDRAKIRAVAPARADAEAKARALQSSPLATLGGATRDALVEVGRLERLARRQVLAEQGQPAKSLILLVSGRARLERRTRSATFPVGHRGPGETVGETSVAGPLAAAEDAIMADEGEGLLLPVPAVRKLLVADAQLRLAMATLLVERQRAAEERLQSLLLDGVEARLIELLLRAESRWGQEHPAGRVIAAPFTHADLALLIGSTRETVTLLLGKLRRDGLIELDRRRVVIRDRAGLEQRAAAP